MYLCQVYVGHVGTEPGVTWHQRAGTLGDTGLTPSLDIVSQRFVSFGQIRGGYYHKIREHRVSSNGT